MAGYARKSTASGTIAVIEQFNNYEEIAMSKTNGWDNVSKRASRGPWSAFGILLAVMVVMSIVGYLFGWIGETTQVAQDEFGPRAALVKYEWFIDQSGRIEKMNQDVKIFETRIASIDGQYSGYGENKSSWPLNIQTQYNQQMQLAQDDLLAITSQRNNLIREYNAASEKFNWSPFQTRPDKPNEQFFEYSVH